jgi:hypothetical protein
VSESQVAEARALRLLESISDAFATRDWELLRSLYDDRARIVAVAAGEGVLDPDQLIQVLSASEPGSYSTDDAQTEALDAQAVVVWGIARQREVGETTFTPSAWLLTFRDGLVWRSKAYRSVDAARSAYREHGLDLGTS